MKTPTRLLGLAFASADLLFELDGAGVVAFAMGAGPATGIDPAKTWTGKPLADLLCKASRREVAAALADMTPGARSNSIDVLVNCPGQQVRRARLRAFQLPALAPAVSCALTWNGAPFALTVPQAAPMLDARGLLEHARALLQDSPDLSLSFAFVDVPGLSMKGEPNQRATARIEAVLQTASVDGAGAARLAPERFAVVRSAAAPDDLAEGVREAGRAEGVDLLPAAAQAVLEAGIAPDIAVRALRFTLEDVIRQGAAAGEGFAGRLTRTLQDADRFRSVVRDRSFALHYQPIVDLGTEALHHFEALARFGSGGPAPTIRMAEELGLIEGFDLAVAEKALQQLRRPGFGLMKVAVNVSGRSLGGDAYVDGLLRMTAAAPEHRKRLMIEVTETAAVSDLDGADRRLRALRAAGIKVCLDDFGVGAASFDYIGQLGLDVVKIDGTFVRDVATSDRARTLIAHLVELCADLKITTVAEMIETDEQAGALKALGVDYGQGWLFGRPAAEPVLPSPVVASRARRVGETASWG